MMNAVSRVLLLATLTVLLATTVVYAQPCPTDQGRLVAYFDAAGTQRYTDAGPVGDLVTVYIFGEGFGNTIPFVSGMQFCVDYGPNMTWLADVPLYGAFIGATDCYNPIALGGLSVGFGLNPQPGGKFLVARAICVWDTDCVGQNVDGPIVREHQLFPDPCPIASRFPDQETFSSMGVRSQTCQFVQLDFLTKKCPNKIKIKDIDKVAGGKKKGGKYKVAILGSETVDVNDIDPMTLSLLGVAPDPDKIKYHDKVTLNAIAALADDDDDDDPDADCYCNKKGKDGYVDLNLEFAKQDVLLALANLPGYPYSQNDVVTLTLTGSYYDGMPFEAVDCVLLTGHGYIPGDKSSGSKSSHDPQDMVGLGLPSPNPFNPVTRISYNVPTSQHVRIAIYDVAGRLVENLVNETKAAGEYVVEWDAGRLPSGVYFYRMQAGDQTLVRRVTLLK
jgi:hypothetical protein